MCPHAAHSRGGGAVSSAGRSKGLPDNVECLRRMIAYLIAIGDFEELYVPPNWSVHLLTGDRAGIWSLIRLRGPSRRMAAPRNRRPHGLGVGDVAAHFGVTRMSAEMASVRAYADDIKVERFGKAA